MSYRYGDKGLWHEQMITVLTHARDPGLTPAVADILSDAWCRCHSVQYAWTWATTQGTPGSHTRHHRLRWGNEERCRTYVTMIHRSV